jgi:hypothetical protein
MKSGTTSLHQYLARHPRIFMPEPKEQGYFVEELNWSQSKAWYLRLFEASGDAQIIGESSTRSPPSPLDSAAVVEALRPRIVEQVSALSRLLGRSFPEWTTVGGQILASV